MIKYNRAYERTATMALKYCYPSATGLPGDCLLVSVSKVCQVTQHQEQQQLAKLIVHWVVTYSFTHNRKSVFISIINNTEKHFSKWYISKTRNSKKCKTATKMQVFTKDAWQILCNLFLFKSKRQICLLKGN